MNLIRAGTGQDAQWEKEVRDPANHARGTDPRTVEALLEYGRVWCGYTIAPIPAGWAWQSEAHYGHVYEGGWTPWTGPYSQQQAAEDAALDSLLRVLSRGRPATDRAIAWVQARRVQEALF